MGKFKGIPGKKQAQSEINVTPLIDVVLVLLIIFMVLTPIMINEMSVNLPDKTETVEEEDDVPKDQLLLAVCEDGTMTLNRTPFEPEPLAKSLTKRLRSKAKKVVFVDAHPDANAGRRQRALRPRQQAVLPPALQPPVHSLRGGFLPYSLPPHPRRHTGRHRGA